MEHGTVDTLTERDEWRCVWVAGRRWRTVCTGNQELAGAVCSQMGYIFEGNIGNYKTDKRMRMYKITTQEALWHLTHFLLEHFQSTE